MWKKTRNFIQIPSDYIHHTPTRYYDWFVGTGFYKMTGSPESPLARLVVFMVCLSVAGGIVAGVHYYTVDLPQQQSLQAPTNAYDCWDVCNIQWDACRALCYQGSGAICDPVTCALDYKHCLRKCDRYA